MEGRARIPACAVGRLGDDGPWVGVAPALDDRYALTFGWADRSHRLRADATDLAAVAAVYFEESLTPPPDDLAATLGDIGAIVRHAADLAGPAGDRRVYEAAVDAIDDGLAADVVLERLAAALGPGLDAASHLRRRAEMADGGAGGSPVRPRVRRPVDRPRAG